MSDNSVYNDPTFNITSVPSWKSPPLHGAYAPNARLSPRAKAGLAAGGVVLAASGLFAWSNYASDQADAEVRKAQIGLESSRIDLERQKQAAELAKTAGQETASQKARREAVQACVNKAGGSYNAVEDCGKAFPLVDTPGMGTVSQTVNRSDDNGPVPVSGLVVLGAVAAVGTVGWVKKRFASL